MQLIDPTATNPTQDNQLAPRLGALANMRIGLLCNGKANARPLLLKTAELFRVHDKCTVLNDMVFKTNASAPAEDGVIASLAARSDILITANGD
tara:strand:- start:2490 stop:2771 length:282 start_codon:yes stop_codon:yes gene_type:complete